MPQNSIFLGIGFCIGNLFWSLITALIASAVQSLKIQPWSLVLNGNAPCERKITFKTHVWSTYTKKKKQYENSQGTVRIWSKTGLCTISLTICNIDNICKEAYIHSKKSITKLPNSRNNANSLTPFKKHPKVDHILNPFRWQPNM